MHRFPKILVVSILSLLLALSFIAVACTPASPANQEAPSPAASTTPEGAVSLPPSPPGTINTATGFISPDQLGTTLVHEHFCFAYPGWFADDTIAPYNREAALQTGLKVCETLKSIGVKTVIDPTPNDTGGRDPLLYKELSKRTGIQIICTTGLYTDAEGSPAYWKTRMAFMADLPKMMSDLFIKEITEGIGTTGVKAGAIKVGSSPKMTKYEEAVHEAAVIAQKATGVPIITHTDGPSGGVEQAEFLIAAGADPKKIQIGHVNNSDDIKYHRAILAKGTKMAFDRIGLTILYGVPDDITVQNIATLVKEGYANQIELSHDTVNFWIGRPIEVPPKAMPLFKDWRIDHISKDILPALKAQGVTDEQINIMMVENPRNLFLGK
ncbi:MAG: phosphotriesterase-related protein [Dehalococcoidia bacterium]|nr:phosphotriesterase-related protein [Dehalococcoidia bacterium]MDD5494147.1 phosphotriesterase-related protein [Dehalococcoidia bacterium]